MSPSRALHPCSYPGCPELLQHGSRCDAHKHVDAPAFKRDQERQNLYDRNWQRRRKVQLTQQPWCEDCLELAIYTEATDVHHVERHEGDVEIFLNSPLRSLCHACHSRHTAHETRGKGPRKDSARESSSALSSATRKKLPDQRLKKLCQPL